MKGYFDAYRPARDQSAFNHAREFEALFFSKINNRVIDWEGQFEDVPDPENPHHFLLFLIPKAGAFHVTLRSVDSSGNLVAPAKHVHRHVGRPNKSGEM